MRNRIKDLEAEAGHRRESYIRAWNLTVGAVAGIVITVVTTWLTR
jgi:F0F1-type ATP synthase assembly protein I